MSDEVWRVFWAVPVAVNISKQWPIATYKKVLVGDWQWHLPVQRHLTLCFCAQAPVAKIDAAAEQLARTLGAMPYFTVVLTQCAVVGGETARHWGLMGAASTALNQLHQMITQQMLAVGLPIDQQAFLPHVTLAHRPAGGVPCAAVSLDTPIALLVDQVCLYRSHVGGQGAYERLLCLPLLDGGGC
jgi:2'-5' RNA ligase